MTKEEALQIPDLCIEVTPIIEDAFYFLQNTENSKTTEEICGMSDEEWQRYDKYCEAANNAGSRLLKLPHDERMAAIRQAYRMLDNIRHYGIPCADWLNT